MRLKKIYRKIDELYHKARRVIWSCNTFEQLKSAKNYQKCFYNYCRSFEIYGTIRNYWIKVYVINKNIDLRTYLDVKETELIEKYDSKTN